MTQVPGIRRTDELVVAKNFNAAASQYDSVAILQKAVAERMFERLELMQTTPKSILDLGAGTGMAARHLAKIFRNARVVQLDFALQMLFKSRESSPRILSRHSYVCADAAKLPFANSVFEMVYSNLMLQWCNDPGAVFFETQRVTKVGGLFIFSSFGPDTLHELKASWSAADNASHVNSFIDMHDIGDTLIRAGFEQPVMERENFTLTYSDVTLLFRELKLLGARNANAGRRHTLTGKNRLQKAINAYEHFRSDGKIPATYEVIYGHAWRGPTISGAKQDKSSHAIPIAAISRSRKK